MSRQTLIDYGRFRAKGRELGREGMSERVIAAVAEWEKAGRTYKGAMILAGRLQAIAHMASGDDYWREQVEKGLHIERVFCRDPAP